MPIENTFAALEAVEKVQKYLPLADALCGRGCVVHVDGFVVGVLGAWHPNNDGVYVKLTVTLYTIKVTVVALYTIKIISTIKLN